MIIVKDRAGNSHQLEGRLEAIVLAIVENAGEIARPLNARVEIDLSGGKVSAAIKHSLEVPAPEV